MITKNSRFQSLLIIIVVLATCIVPRTADMKASPKNIKFYEIIKGASYIHGISPALIAAVIQAESNFEETAKSYAGAKGLMQINRPTQKFLGLDNPFNPHENIYAGTRYLKYLLDKFEGNLVNTIAAYNAGPGAVMKYNGVPPYRETIKYVSKVLSFYSSYLKFIES